MNKPLVLSLPKRSPRSSTTFLTSAWKDMDLPVLLQVPAVSSKAKKNQSDFMSLRNKRLCSTCREIKMVQPRTVIIPDYLKQSFENFTNQRMTSLHQRRAQTAPKPTHKDNTTESIHYRLPLLGPRTAVFQGLLSDAYRVLQENQHSFVSRKEPWDQTVTQ